MQGYWKNNVNGYDKKGNKRRRQTFKHFIKDKYESIEKKYKKKEKMFDKELIRDELLLEKTYLKENGKYIEEKVTIFYTRVFYKEDFRIEKEGYHKIKEEYKLIYFENNSYGAIPLVWPEQKPLNEVLGLKDFYYEKKEKKEEKKYYFNYNIDTVFDLKYELLYPYKEIEWNIKNQKMYKKEKVEITQYENQFYFYNKPILKNINQRYKTKKSSKSGQRITNKVDRQKKRNWIKKEDWNKPFNLKIKRGWWDYIY